ncbi:MAG: ABC transporter ATP-binding protein [Anaerolineae bacterium]|nr:ABC transporter ATP-binding protein [Chloroflexota bacterium]MBP6298381.1 ABC transporter ATP-binding protein [Anaerolineae bacterium]
MANHSIVAEDLTYTYGTLMAVNNISFEVGEGEILGYLGPNGAGKSTTVKILTGQLRAKSGRATLLGMDIARDANKVQQQIGVAFETTNLYEQMSAVENLTLFARLFGVKTDVNNLIEKVGLGPRAKERVSNFSKGMKQRLMVARALVNHPRILFLDEPTEGLDPVSSESIRNLILETRAGGTTVFLTTHDMYEADRLSDRVAFINQGKILALDTPYKLKQQYGKRLLKVEIETADGQIESREIALDTADTGAAAKALLDGNKVITMHSEEATLEDIFIQITGRGLMG